MGLRGKNRFVIFGMDNQRINNYFLWLIIFLNIPQYFSICAICKAQNSKALILLLPAGKSAHIEAGVAFGMKKKCILIGEQKEAESLYLIFAESYQTIDEFIDGLL